MGKALIVRRGTVPEIGLFIEPGLIVEWYGLSTALPEGWLLCDGANSTPNLIDKFIIGAGDTYAIGAQGGSANAILPSHTHTGSTNTAGNHTHVLNRGNSFSNGNGFVTPLQHIPIGTNTSTSSGNHSHSISLTTVGDSATNQNLPPYLSLFYIIKEEE